MDLNFNACLTLLIIAFIFALIVCRYLAAIVNGALAGAQELKKSVMGGGDKPPTMAQAMGMLVGGIASKVGPALGDMILGKIGGKK